LTFTYVSARAERHLARWGWISLGYDLFALALLPWSWYRSIGGSDVVSLAFFMKSDVAFLTMVMIGIHSLTLRPVYPLVIVGFATLQALAFLGIALSDSSATLGLDAIQHLTTDAVHVGFWGWRVVSVLLLGCFAATASWSARRTVLDAILFEQENAKIRMKQALLISQSKVESLATLVAGVAHELNTPLGALKSSSQTSESCRRRIEEQLNEPSEAKAGGVGKWLSALKETERVSAAAVERIQRLVASLTSFARLDRAERQNIDLSQSIDTALSLIPDAIRGKVEVVRDFEQLEPVFCRPRDVHQVLYTVLRNAFEAMNGEGQLRLSGLTTLEFHEIVIADTGPGVTFELRERLFELNFSPRSGRIGVSFGLPTAHAVLTQYGGELRLDEDAGPGATFRMRLPRHTEDSFEEPTIS
jgi:signal transduction histidine kinase